MRMVLLICVSLSAATLKAESADEQLAVDVLTPDEWESVNLSVDRALSWLADQQAPDGSFPTLPHGQPGVTSLCSLAFLAQGHLPGEGEYGAVMERALAYVRSCQKQNGLLAFAAPNRPVLSRQVGREIGTAASYNHAIAGLVLSESYAMTGTETAKQIQPVIEKALEVTCQMQDWPKPRPVDDGGWRYVNKKDEYDSDLSVTGWHLMFFRSAKNAGFDVSEHRIDRAIVYVQRCFQSRAGAFTYYAGDEPRTSRGMAGAGILALAHSGLHHTPEAQRAGDFILESGFDRYNTIARGRSVFDRRDRYFYGLFTCSQAMYQLGGRHWQDFFPPAASVLIRNQNADGSWHRENHRHDAKWGKAYTTAASVLALSASNQLLPIFQR